MDPIVIAAGIGLVGTVISSYAAMKAKQAENHTRGNGTGSLIEILERTENKVDGLNEAILEHEALHARHDLPNRVEDLEMVDKWLE